MKMACPHCGKPLKIRTSRIVSLITRELYFQCENVECTFTSRYLLSGAETLTPSRNPNPLVYLPLSKAKRLPHDPRQMDMLDTGASG